MSAIYNPNRVFIAVVMLKQRWPSKLVYLINKDWVATPDLIDKGMRKWVDVQVSVGKVDLDFELINTVVACCIHVCTEGKHQHSVVSPLAQLIQAAYEYEEEHGTIVSIDAFIRWFRESTIYLSTDDSELIQDFLTAICLYISEQGLKSTHALSERTSTYTLLPSLGHTVYKLKSRQTCVIHLYSGKRYLAKFIQGKWSTLDDGPAFIDPWEVSTYIPFEIPEVSHDAPSTALDYIRCTLRNDYSAITLINIIKAAVRTQGGTFAEFTAEMTVPLTSATSNHGNLWVSVALGEVDNDYALLCLAKWAYIQLGNMIGTEAVNSILEAAFVISDDPKS